MWLSLQGNTLYMTVKSFFKENTLLVGLALIKLLIHFTTNTGYGFHRDEFLYLDESRHLGWGFLEVPPLTPLIGRIVTALFGDSLFAVRLFPALAGAAMVILIGLMVKEMGGKKWAILVACAAYILSPSFLRSGTLFQPVCFDQFWWFLSAFLLVKAVRRDDRKYWVGLGIAAGLGWMNKYAIAFWIFSLFIGLLISPGRRVLLSKNPLIAFGIALGIALPNLFWQYSYRFPVVHHMTDLAATQLVHVEPTGFLMSQLLMQFAGFLVWIPGVIWLLAARSGRDFRYLGYGYLILLALLLFLSGKDYYALGAYPALMAAGGVAVEQWTSGRMAFLRYAILLLVVGLDLTALPMGVPILSIERMEKYCDRLAKYGVEQRWEDGRLYPVPQDYADMQGWEEMAANVSKKYHALSRDQQSTCLIYGGGYHHAGALNYYRKKYDLPEAYSMNSSYLLWIPDHIHFDNMILLDNVWEDSSAYFSYHEFIDSTHHPYARDNGYVFYRSQPKVNADSVIANLIRREREKIGH